MFNIGNFVLIDDIFVVADKHFWSNDWFDVSIARNMFFMLHDIQQSVIKSFDFWDKHLSLSNEVIEGRDVDDFERFVDNLSFASIFFFEVCFVADVDLPLTFSIFFSFVSFLDFFDFFGFSSSSLSSSLSCSSSSSSSSSFSFSSCSSLCSSSISNSISSSSYFFFLLTLLCFFWVS